MSTLDGRYRPRMHEPRDSSPEYSVPAAAFARAVGEDQRFTRHLIYLPAAIQTIIAGILMTISVPAGIAIFAVAMWAGISRRSEASESTRRSFAIMELDGPITAHIEGDELVVRAPTAERRYHRSRTALSPFDGYTCVRHVGPFNPDLIPASVLSRSELSDWAAKEPLKAPSTPIRGDFTASVSPSLIARFTLRALGSPVGLMSAFFLWLFALLLGVFGAVWAQPLFFIAFVPLTELGQLVGIPTSAGLTAASNPHHGMHLSFTEDGIEARRDGYVERFSWEHITDIRIERDHIGSSVIPWIVPINGDDITPQAIDALQDITPSSTTIEDGRSTDNRWKERVLPIAAFALSFVVAGRAVALQIEPIPDLVFLVVGGITLGAATQILVAAVSLVTLREMYRTSSARVGRPTRPMPQSAPVNIGWAIAAAVTFTLSVTMFAGAAIWMIT